MAELLPVINDLRALLNTVSQDTPVLTAMVTSVPTIRTLTVPCYYTKPLFDGSSYIKEGF